MKSIKCLYALSSSWQGYGSLAWTHVACSLSCSLGRRVGFKNAQPFFLPSEVNKHLLSNHKSSNKRSPKNKNKKKTIRLLPPENAR